MGTFSMIHWLVVWIIPTTLQLALIYLVFRAWRAWSRARDRDREGRGDE